MPVIELSTYIRAPRERCFDLARSIDLHQDSTTGTHEKAVAGVTSGLINSGEEVTWRARHLGIYQTLTSEITECRFPEVFEDCMVHGAFKRFCHRHLFIEHEGGTLMKDLFDYDAPLGILGIIAEKLFLTAYLRRFLIIRNQIIKEVAEGEGWRKYLNA